MGQARRRGTYEQRKAAAVLIRDEALAWAEYHKRERERLEQWFFSKLTFDEKLEFARREVEREIMFQEIFSFAPMIPLSYIRGR